jgi:hypothetical protein
MSQQWEYRTVMLYGPNVNEVNAELTKWAAQGWELVNGSYGLGMGVTSAGAMWLFWRRAK